ncbi:P-loop containing nucleoside triphosphate hydrolase protein [Blyttiomyces helicus]|uniref:P-loop containing nucleoside triphosphate hydrolase protein n=1 Tax=Blyttiomyces helicus TaxID=388810 RepID=A0A4P9WC25_9FUNG|nr:P-loop containing nucleoside triphosphate hydrolase protein [Blyttiomyces helicus]|eukprot:RKO89852.1 P-loop containing nucleoside triphosphate hydrolase protein [Blyttiomyces helicus]
MASPYFLNALTKWVEDPKRDMSVGWGLLAGMFCTLCLRALFNGLLHHASRRALLSVRAISVDEIYQKTLRRCSGIKKNDDEQSEDASLGKIVTLMSKDVERLCEYTACFHRLVCETTLTVVLSLGGLFAIVGCAAFVSLAIIVLCLPAGVFLGNYMDKMDEAIMESTDKRVNAVNKMLQDIRIVKYFAWEPQFIKRINVARSPEIDSWIRVHYPHLRKLPDHRLRDLFRLHPRPRSSPRPSAAPRPLDSVPPDAPPAGEGCKDSSVPDFHDIDVEFPVARLSLVTGGTGSGKSSLILALLGGKLWESQKYLPTSHAVAYVAQTAWIINATIRDNILFGASYDAKRYQETIEACALIRDLEILEGGDLTEINEKGINLSGGQKARISLTRAAYSHAPHLLLDDPLSAVDAPTAKHPLHHCLLGVMKNRTVVLVSQAVSLVLPRANFALVLKSGRVVAKGTPDDLVRNPAAEGVFGLELTASDRETLVHVETATAALQGTGTKLVDDEQKAAGAVLWAVYWFYFEAAGGVVFLSLCSFTMLLTNGLNLLDNLWIQYWTDKVRNATPEIVNGTIRTLVFHAALSSIPPLFGDPASLSPALGLSLPRPSTTTARPSSLASTGLLAGTAMHNNILVSILGARDEAISSDPLMFLLCSFFHDTESVDNTMMSTVELFILGLIAFEAPIFIIGVLPLFYIFWHVANIYLTTARDLKRLESVSRSPHFSQFSETLSGVETVRAYGAQDRLLKASGSVCPLTSSAPSSPSVPVSLSSRLSGTLTAGMTDIILVYAFDFSESLLWFVRYSAEMEMAMNSIESVAEDTATDKGAIRVKDLVIRYAADHPAVLKKISFSVRPGEKVGIVGRTGAGKSTLTLAFFRIVPLASGSITIDGINIDKLGLQDLRSNLTMIPQDPVLFSGTLRSNLDPFEDPSDDALWAALESVHVVDSLGAQ